MAAFEAPQFNLGSSLARLAPQMLAGCVVVLGLACTGEQSEPRAADSELQTGTDASADAGAEGVDSGAGEPDASRATVCWLQPLPDWSRCEFSGDSRYTLEVESDSAQDCVDACLSADDCGAVFDYYWRGGVDFGCYLLIGEDCSSPMAEPWARGDGAREYRKVCGEEVPADGILQLDGPERFAGCTFDAVMFGQACAEAPGAATDTLGADTLDGCFEQCAQRDDCGSVSYWLEPDGSNQYECVLHLAECGEPRDIELIDPADAVYYFQKNCTQQVDGGKVR